MNSGGRGYSELRLCQYTPAWVTEGDPISKKKRRRRRRRRRKRRKKNNNNNNKRKEKGRKKEKEEGRKERKRKVKVSSCPYLCSPEYSVHSSHTHPLVL